MINKYDIPEELYKEVLKAQIDKGRAKYGHTLKDCPKEKYDWFRMALEELIDFYQYVDKLKECKDGIEIRKEKNGATLLLYGKKVHHFDTLYKAEKFVSLFIG